MSPRTAQAPCPRASQEAPGCQSLKHPTVSATGGGGRGHPDCTPLNSPAAGPTRAVPTLGPKKPRRPEALHAADFGWGAGGTLAVKDPGSVLLAEKRPVLSVSCGPAGGPGDLAGTELCLADLLIWAQGLLLLLPPTQEAPTALFARKGVSSEEQVLVPMDPL